MRENHGADVRGNTIAFFSFVVVVVVVVVACSPSCTRASASWCAHAAARRRFAARTNVFDRDRDDRDDRDGAWWLPAARSSYPSSYPYPSSVPSSCDVPMSHHPPSRRTVVAVTVHSARSLALRSAHRSSVWSVSPASHNGLCAGERRDTVTWE